MSPRVAAALKALVEAIDADGLSPGQTDAQAAQALGRIDELARKKAEKALMRHGLLRQQR